MLYRTPYKSMHMGTKVDNPLEYDFDQGEILHGPRNKFYKTVSSPHMLQLPASIYRERMLIFSSALCYCTAELLSSRGRPSSAVRPSVKTVFSEPVKHINAKFGGKVPFHHISRPCFCLFFKILHF